MKNKLFDIANAPQYGYINRALGKISRLALVGYNKSAHTVRYGLFLCVFSLCIRIVMVKLEGEAFALASYLIYWSTNPFQLCHPYLVVIGKASALKSGAHSHA